MTRTRTLSESWNHMTRHYPCPGWVSHSRNCTERFATERGLEQHMRASGHAVSYFRYAKHVSEKSCTCTICGYVPVYNVDNPTKCLHDHMRRRHRLEWVRERKPYTIAEEP